MIAPQSDANEPRPAGPDVAAEGPAGGGNASVLGPSASTPPAGGDSAEDAKGSGAGPSPSSPEAGEAQVEEDLDALLADTQRERDEYLELARRTKADFENFRKRMASEVQAATARGKGELIREVVPVLDDLERALQAAGLDPEGDSPDGLAHGVLLVFRSLRETLTRNGIEAEDPTGEKFDPNLHEALSTQPADGVESGVVIETMQKGYKLGEQLIRPARVVVAE